MAKKEKKSGRKDERGLAAGQLDKSTEKAEQKASENKGTREAPRPRPKSAADKKKDRRDGIVKTVFAAALGVLAGFGCYYIASSTGELPWQIGEYPWHFILLSVVLFTSLLQRVAYPLLKIDAASFKTKDWLYVEFIVVDLWLVTWTILLN
ncbi:MAG TPA: hypothetical protein PLQ01_10400 [Methanothrix sp.]|nr:hypothetical protein [Methanothrix sp.]